MKLSNFSQLFSSTRGSQTTGPGAAMTRPNGTALAADFLGNYSLQNAVPASQGKTTETDGESSEPVDRSPDAKRDDGPETIGVEPGDATVPESSVGDHLELAPLETKANVPEDERTRVDVTAGLNAEDPAPEQRRVRPEDRLVTWPNAPTTYWQGESLFPRAALSAPPPDARSQQGQLTDQTLALVTPDTLGTGNKTGQPRGTAEISAMSRPQQALYPLQAEVRPGRARDGALQHSINPATWAGFVDPETAAVSGDAHRAGLANPSQLVPVGQANGEKQPKTPSAAGINARDIPQWPVSRQLSSAPASFEPVPAQARATQPDTPSRGPEPILRAPSAPPLSGSGTPGRPDMATGLWSADDGGNALTSANDGGLLQGELGHGIDFALGGRDTLYSGPAIGASPFPATTTAPPETARQIASQMASAIAASPEAGTVDIRLDPEELGSVQMSLKLRDGSLTMAIVADRPETLDLMRRHIDQLSAEFRAMGYSDVTFSFAVSQNGYGTEGRQTGDQGHAAPETPETVPGAQETSRPHIVANGLDMRL